MLKIQQQHRVEHEYDDENLIRMKEQMGKVEEEKGKAFKEPRQMKNVAEDNKNIVGLKNEGKDSSMEKLKEEMKRLRSSEADSMSIVSDYKKRVQELEGELEKRKESEANLFDTLVVQTKQLELSKISLEESKILIGSLEEKLKALQGVVAAAKNTKICGGGGGESKAEIFNGLSTKENSCDCDGEGPAKKAKALLEELNKVKDELRSAIEAEENSKKAMDDLAFALKEVTTESNQVKAKLTLSQVELEHSKGDAERWRAILESTEEKYKQLLDVTKKEADRYKNTAERLRLEAEESHLAWNGKETEFVNCIRKGEEERLLVQEETTRLLELLKEAENKTIVSKEENQKLRDILKQALNEANVAKEALEIAKAENVRLHENLTLLVQENEMLKIHEAASFENIRELKRILSETSSTKEFKIEDNQKPPSTKEGAKDDKESTRRARAHHSSVDHREHKETKNLSKTFSFNLKDMISPHKPQKLGNEESNKEANDGDTLLKGSIFDDVEESSDSEKQDDDIMVTPDEFDQSDDSHFEESESERNSRKRRALLRRFGDLIRRRSSNNYSNNRKEPSIIEEHIPT